MRPLPTPESGMYQGGAERRSTSWDGCSARGGRGARRPGYSGAQGVRRARGVRGPPDALGPRDARTSPRTVKIAIELDVRGAR